MKALIYHGPRRKSLDDRPKSQIVAAGDALVRITHTTICGIGLHIPSGDLPRCAPDRIPSHKGGGGGMVGATEMGALQVLITP